MHIKTGRIALGIGLMLVAVFWIPLIQARSLAAGKVADEAQSVQVREAGYRLGFSLIVVKGTAETREGDEINWIVAFQPDLQSSHAAIGAEADQWERNRRAQR
jgi:hypothetical protein